MDFPEKIIGMRGFYIHIPFCAQKCSYCNFVITLQQSSAARERFFTACGREIERTFQIHGKIPFDTFYIGGGTPSLLTPEEMTQLVETIKNQHEFKPDFEFTCEFNPGDLDSKKISEFTFKSFRSSMSGMRQSIHLLMLTDVCNNCANDTRPPPRPRRHLKNF